MNFFFGINNKEFLSTITIPKFQNNSKQNNEYKVFVSSIIKNNWTIEKLDCSEDKNFFFIDSKLITNEKNFFLSKEKHIKSDGKNLLEMVYPNKFTDTSPAYRASLEITKKNGGFSSYQSEYPYGMINKKSQLLSPLSTLLDVNAESNYLIFRNIFCEPEHKSFYLYIVDIYKMMVLKKIEVLTNKTNIIPIDNEFIEKKAYIFSDTFLGIPIFLSVNNGHLSLEHTHPPYHYILGKKNFQLANKLKNRIYEKIFKKNIPV